jgi:hypothetical protein
MGAGAVANPYAEFQKPATGTNPYAEFQSPATKAPIQNDGSNSALPTTTSRLFGSNPVSDMLGTVGTHLKNLVAAPYHAFTDDPRNPQEAAMVDAHGGVNNAPTSVLSAPKHVNPVLSGLNRLGLGAARMFVEPTQEAVNTAITQHKAGNNTGEEYDDQGNYHPNAVGSAMDAIPLVGPLARSIENDAHKNGVLPALAGGAVDLAGPEAMMKGAGGLMRGAGLASEAASATPASLKVAATRGLVMGTPEELLNRSLKPSVAYPDFEESTHAALPTIHRMNPGSGVKGFADAVDRAKQATHHAYERMKAPVANDPLDTTPLVQKQVQSIPATERFETPGIVGGTRAHASAYDMTPQTSTVNTGILDQYGKPISRTVTQTPQHPTLSTLDDIRKDTNAKLAQKVFESPNRNTALSNPETARLNAVNSGTRDLVYKRIADANGIPESEVRDNQNLYGHLADIGEVAGKRATVAGRSNPISLQESLGFNHGNPMSGAYNFATQRLLKGLTDSDAVTDAAMSRFRSPNQIELQPRPGVLPRMGSAGGKLLGNADKAVAKLPLKFNPFLYNPRQDNQ